MTPAPAAIPASPPVAPHTEWVDFGNYAGNVRPDQLACLRDAGIVGVVVGVLPRRADLALRQMQTVADAGLRLMVYGEPTTTTGPAFADVIRIADGFRPERYWIDIEPAPEFGYEPDAAAVLAAVAVCREQGVACGVYTGGWVLQRYRWLQGVLDRLPDLPLWLAVYDGVADLEGQPDRVAGKQYRGSHQRCGITVDANVFRI